MKILTRNETAQYLLQHDNFCILSHRRPDGDTLGSTAALCLGLRQMGKTAHVIANREVSPRYRWLHQGLTKEEARESDTVITVDVAAPQMLPEFFQNRIRLSPAEIRFRNISKKSIKPERLSAIFWWEELRKCRE